jgi:hypothetical protein
LFGLRVKPVVGHDGNLTAVRRRVQTCDFLEVDASRAHVVLQPEVIPFASLRQQALFDDHIRDDLVGGRVALGRAVGILDDVDADRPDEAIDADLQDFVDARIGSQHQRHEGCAEQHTAVGCLGIEAHADWRRAPTVATIGCEYLAKVADQPLLGRPDSSVAQPDRCVGRISVLPVVAAQPRIPVSNWPHEPRHGFRGMHLDEIPLRVRVDPRVRGVPPMVTSIECLPALLRSRRRLLDPLGIPSLAELVQPPDGELESDRAGVPTEVLHAHRVRAGLAG